MAKPAAAAKQVNKVADNNPQSVKKAQDVEKVIEQHVKQDPKVAEAKPMQNAKEAVVKKPNEQLVKAVPKEPVTQEPAAKKPENEREQPVVPKKPVAKQPQDEKVQPAKHEDKSKDSDNSEENAVDGNQTKEEGEDGKETHDETNEVEEKPTEKKKGLGVGKVLKKQGQAEGKGYKLAKDPRCAEDVKQLCSSLPKDNNFAILVCLQDAAVVSCAPSLYNLYFFYIYFMSRYIFPTVIFV